MVLYAYLSPLQRKLHLKSTHSWQCFGESWEAQERMVSISSSNLSRISLKCLFLCLYRHRNSAIASTLPTRSMFTERETWILSKTLVLGQTPHAPPPPRSILHTSCLGMGLVMGEIRSGFSSTCMYVYDRTVVGKTEAIWGGIFNPKNEFP